ncbi:MAG TPA: hypothetical protein VHM30_11740 [Gemmatimonadaceae bacterium]|nr:hypothetical protein [Gemmatimonadaceae bacterium]
MANLRRWVGAAWWLLIVAPAVQLAETIDVGLTAHSADEACCGLGPGMALLLVAFATCLVILVRALIRWRRTPRPERLEELAVGLAAIPMVLVAGYTSDPVSWPRARSASAGVFAQSIAIVVAWMVIVFVARRRLRITEADPRS